MGQAEPLKARSTSDTSAAADRDADDERNASRANASTVPSSRLAPPAEVAVVADRSDSGGAAADATASRPAELANATATRSDDGVSDAGAASNATVPAPGSGGSGGASMVRNASDARAPSKASMQDPPAGAVATAASADGHGVASAPEWRQRRPRDIGDDEELDEAAFALDPAKVRAIADREGYIMVTWANDHYFDFVANWAAHLEALGVSAFLVGAMDGRVLRRLLRAGIPTFAMQSGLTPNDFGWGSANFHKMGRKKIELVQRFTELNVTVLISDVDTVWLRRPFEYVKRYPEADVLTSSDSLAETHPDDGLEDWRRAGAAYNIGIMLFSPRAAAFAAAWVAALEADEKVWDQAVFNGMIREGMTALPDGDARAEQRLFLGYRGTLVCGILPVALFASGQTFFVARLHEQLGLQPYVVHATFQFSGTPGKRFRFREAMLWHDEPEYYDPRHGLLAFDLDVPPALRDSAAPAPPALRCCDAQRGHFDAVNHQLLQMRAALAIASSLGLGVIVPQFLAGQERYWAPHAGRLPGSKTPLPYLAPVDHIFDLERGLGAPRGDAAAFGPDVPIREHSFLANPRTPESVTSSVLTVELCDGDDTGDAGNGGDTAAACGGGDAPATVRNGIVRVRAGLSDAQLRVSLGEAVAKHRVVRFPRILGAFSRHADDADHARFERRAAAATSLWCCVQPDPGTPGHVWYDMWWDAVPHTDRHDRVWNSSWHILTGP